jgi:hypothetical protein
MRAENEDVLEENRPLLVPPVNLVSLDATWNRLSPTVLYCFVIMILVSTSYAIAEAPLYRLYESVICTKYYREHDPSVIGKDGTVPEAMCKLDSIQQALAIILTKQVQFNFWACQYMSFHLLYTVHLLTKLALVASFYTALIGRKFGRKLILILNLTFFFCAQVWICLFCMNTFARNRRARC